MPRFIDGHADTIHRIWEGRVDLGQRNEHQDIDLVRAREAGLVAQFFAIAPICRGVYREPYPRWALMMLDVFYETLAVNADAMMLATTAQDVHDAEASGKVAVFLVLEGGDFLDGQLGLLRMYHRLGVRLLTLTHFRRNALADATPESATAGRLTRFGVDVVRELFRLGILCDVAHVADPCVDHVFDLAERPIVFSHANVRALCDHHRNVTDRHLRRLAENGGLIGLSFVPFFIDRTAPTLDRFLDHVDHAVQTAGIDHVGFGSDFDGFDEPRVPGLDNVACYPRVAEALSQRGYSNRDIEKIAGENWLRVIREAIG